MSNGRSSEWKRGSPMGYISKEIPEPALPAYEGKREERMEPDTLDVAERADFAIHFLTNVVNPEADYESYFPVALYRNPPGHVARLEQRQHPVKVHGGPSAPS